MSAVHLIIIIASVLIIIGLDVYVFVRLARLGEGFSGRVVFWSILTIVVPIIGALGVLAAMPRTRKSVSADS